MTALCYVCDAIPASDGPTDEIFDLWRQVSENSSAPGPVPLGTAPTPVEELQTTYAGDLTARSSLYPHCWMLYEMDMAISFSLSSSDSGDGVFFDAVRLPLIVDPCTTPITDVFHAFHAVHTQSRYPRIPRRDNGAPNRIQLNGTFITSTCLHVSSMLLLPHLGLFCQTIRGIIGENCIATLLRSNHNDTMRNAHP